MVIVIYETRCGCTRREVFPLTEKWLIPPKTLVRAIYPDIEAPTNEEYWDREVKARTRTFKLRDIFVKDNEERMYIYREVLDEG